MTDEDRSVAVFGGVCLAAAMVGVLVMVTAAWVRSDETEDQDGRMAREVLAMAGMIELRDVQERVVRVGDLVRASRAGNGGNDELGYVLSIEHTPRYDGVVAQLGPYPPGGGPEPRIESVAAVVTVLHPAPEPAAAGGVP